MISARREALHTRIPFVTLRRSDASDLCIMLSVLLSVVDKWRHRKLTRRGTPSGSPMLITVCSCCANEEPVQESVNDDRN